MSEFDLPLSIVLGVGLAAATGLRVFLPKLVVSGADYAGHLPLAENFAWLGTVSALTMLSVAALTEVLAYYIPGVDNLLDALATPSAVVAGTVVSAAVMDLPRFRGRLSAWDQGIWSDGILPSCLASFFCSAPGGAILPSRPA